MSSRMSYFWNPKHSEILIVMDARHWREGSAKLKGFGASQAICLFSRPMTELEIEDQQHCHRYPCYVYKYQEEFLEDEMAVEVDMTADDYQIIFTEYLAKLHPGVSPQRLLKETNP